MRFAIISTILSLVLLAGCTLPPPPPAFLQRVDFDVLNPAPDQPPLTLSILRTGYGLGDEIPVTLEVNLPPKELKQATIQVHLFREGVPKPIHRIALSQLRAGKLTLHMNTSTLPAGFYRLDGTLTPPTGSLSTQSVSFTLTEYVI